MRISRFHLPEAASTGQRLALGQAGTHYIVNVLRLAAGTPVQVFDGSGREFEAILVEAGKRQAVVELGRQLEAATESALSIHLALGLTRGERMDLAIQKGTELGASSFTPVITERCEVKLKGDRTAKKLEHWQQVAVSACEQSGRALVPQVRQPMGLMDYLSACDAPLKFIFDHRQARSMGDMEMPAHVALLTGPEGGFTDDEIVRAVESGFRPVRLGNRILRAETAPLAALSVLQWLWGDFSQND